MGAELDKIKNDAKKETNALKQIIEDNNRLLSNIYEDTSKEKLDKLLEVVDERKDKLQKIIDAINKDRGTSINIDNLSDSYKDLLNVVDNYKKQIKQANKELSNQQSIVSKNKDAYKDAQQELRDYINLSEQLGSYEIETYRKLQQKVEDCKNEFEYASIECERLKGNVDALNDSLNETEDAVSSLNNASTDYYSAANDAQRELNRRQREGITILDDWKEKYDTVTSTFRKGINNIKNGANTVFDSLKKTIEPWSKANAEAMAYARNMGMSQKTAQAYLDRTVSWAADNNIGLLFNKTTDELIKLQSRYSDVLGRNVQLSGEQTKDMLALEKFLGEDGMTEIAYNLENFGLGMSDSAEFVHKTMSEATKHGIAASKLTKTIRENIKMAQDYTFKNGLDGLTSMAKKAIELKTDMSIINSLIDKTSTVEGAISTGANLQVLGGAYAMGSDPLSMLYESLNDVEGLFDRAMNMSKGKVFYNSATGNFEMGAMDRYMMKQAATVLGIDPSKMIDAAYRQASLSKIEGAISQSQIANDEDMVRMVKNTATWKNGEAVVNVNGVDKKVRDLTKEDKRALEAASKNDSQNLQSMAVDLRSLTDKIEGFEKEMFNAQGKLVAPFAQRLDNFLGQNTEILNQFAEIGAWIKIAVGILGALGGAFTMLLGTTQSILGMTNIIAAMGGGGRVAPTAVAGGTVGAGAAAGGVGSKLLGGLKTGAKVGLKTGALAGVTSLGIDLLTGDFQKDKVDSLRQAGGATIGALAGSALGGLVGAIFPPLAPALAWAGGAVGGYLGGAMTDGITDWIKGNTDKTRRDIARELDSSMPELSGIFVGANALQGNYSVDTLQKIKNAASDKVIDYDEIGWWDAGELRANGDIERLKQAGLTVNIPMANGGVIGSKGGKLFGKSHNQGGMPILGSNIVVEGGEYVVNKEATQNNLPLLNKINNGEYSITPNEPLGKQLSVNHNTPSNSLSHNSKIEMAPISINLSGTIKLDTGNTQIDISRNILNNPQIISKLTDMISKQLNILDNGSYNKGYFKQKFI